MRVWQTGGGSRSGHQPPWLLMRLDETSNLTLSHEVSNAPRAGYKRADKAMSRGIKCQV